MVQLKQYADRKNNYIAQRFLQILHHGCKGFLEIRTIHPQNRHCGKFWPSTSEEAATLAVRESKTVNVYFGVATRHKQTNGKKENLRHFPGVWVDLDFKDFKNGAKEARTILEQFPLKPTILVHTGGGFHAYWLLTKPEVITAESLPGLEGLNRAFAERLNGDHCHSAEHILRIPGTTNWPDEGKRKLRRKPTSVRLLLSHGPRYTFDQLQSVVTDLNQTHATTASPIHETRILPARLCALLQEDKTLHATWNGMRTDLHDQSRSGYDMALTHSLTGYGFSNEEIKSILRQRPSGRGQAAKESYLDRTIDKAKEANATTTLSAPNVAKQYLRHRQLQTTQGLLLRHHRGCWLRYNGAAYNVVPLSDLQSDVIMFLQHTRARDKATRHFVADVLFNLEGRTQIPDLQSLPLLHCETGWESRPTVVVLKNGLLDLHAMRAGENSLTLMPHTPNFVSTVQLPYAFDPETRCPRWQSFLKQILPDPESRQLLREIFGYCLTFDTSQQRFFIFEGDGANGKGVITAILMALVGEVNVSSIPLELFAARHGLEVTLGKLVNIASEVGEVDSVAEALLKQFTGGDAMHFNPKYKQPFPAKPTAKLIITTNVRPPFRDRSDGIWRRLILLPFPITIPEKIQNKQLGEELKAELPGILNWAIKGYQALLARGHFTEPAICQTTKAEFRRECNPARAFFQEECATDSRFAVRTTDVYAAYDRYCRGRGYWPVNEANFGKEVRRAFPSVKRKRIRPYPKTSTRIWAYTGLIVNASGLTPKIRLSGQS